MPKVKNDFDTHRELASRTREAHENLHHHPVISQLINPAFSSNSYRVILSAYYRFFRSIEEQREQYDCWHEFALQDHINDLEKDLGHCNETQDISKLIQLNWIQGKISVLGALYVLHGSGFGSRIIVKKLRSSLSEYPHHFFSRGINQIQWQKLVSSLSEAVDSKDDFEILVSAAQNTFHTLGRTVK